MGLEKDHHPRAAEPLNATEAPAPAASPAAPARAPGERPSEKARAPRPAAGRTGPGWTTAERWGLFTRALATYPDSNSRVRQTLSGLTQALSAAWAAGVPMVEILFADESVKIDGVDHAIDDHAHLAWLKSRLDRSGLAGIGFLPNVRGEGLLAFGRRLLANYIRADAQGGLATLWPERYPGLRLIDRRLAGRASPEGAAAPTYAGGTYTSFERARRRKVNLDPGSPRARLAMEAGVMERLSRIRGKLEGHVADDSMPLDLLERIVALLPDDVVQDHGRLRRHTEELLEAVLQGLDDDLLRTRMLGSSANIDLPALLFATSQRYFARAEAVLRPDDVAPEPGSKKTGRPGDEAFGDDLDAFLREHAAMPKDEVKLGPKSVDMPSERLGVHLHYLTHLEDDGRAVKLHRRIADDLTVGGEETDALFRRYVEQACKGKRGAAETVRRRVMRFLRTSGRLRMLRELGVLEPETVAEHFPADFLTYVDTLDLDDPAERAELERLCTTIGAEKIRAASDVLACEAGLLDIERAKRILARGGAGLAPLVELVVLYGGTAFRRITRAWIAATNVELAETCVIDLLPADALPEDYVLTLIRTLHGRADRARLRDRAVNLISEHVLAPSRASEVDLARRQRAVYALASMPHPRGRFLLEEILRRKRFFFFPAEPRPLRRAAKAALDGFGGSR